MTAEPLTDTAPAGDVWAWWQARRLRYNMALGAAGWVAYGLCLTLTYAFGQPMWKNWQSAVSITLFLGTGFLVLMGAANICFLLGPWCERVIKPADVDRFRGSAWRMGFYGSLAVPFVFPVVNFCVLLGQNSL